MALSHLPCNRSLRVLWKPALGLKALLSKLGAPLSPQALTSILLTYFYISIHDILILQINARDLALGL